MHMITLWNTLFYKPLYNALMYLVDVVPGNSLFLAVIILTVLVRIIISPLSYKTIKTQLKTKKIQPLISEIKKTVTDKQEQARKTMALYKTQGINPFSGFLLILVQFPIIIALYWVFRNGGVEVDPTDLYSFVQIPQNINVNTFGLDLGSKSYVLAFLTGFTQYIYLSIASTMKKQSAGANQSEQEKMMAAAGQSMKYVMPVMITIFAFTIGGAVALYWLTSNVFMIIQELVIQKRLKEKDVEGAVEVISN